MMVQFTDLTSNQYEHTLAREFVPLADELRDMLTEFGLRPYKVRIIRIQWSGGERGIGQPSVVSELHLLPTPKVTDLSGLSEIVHSIGLHEVGGILLTEISGRFTEEALKGYDADETPIPPDQEFFYEIEFPRPDGQPSVRRRFFPSSPPEYKAGKLQWTVRLERAHEDRLRNGDAP
jgi:hypothetical protein